MSYVARLEYKGIVKDFKSFGNPRDCLEYILHDPKMIIINFLLCRLDYQFEDFRFVEPNYIHVYDKSQGRYCDSFDF